MLIKKNATEGNSVWTGTSEKHNDVELKVLITSLLKILRMKSASENK